MFIEFNKEKNATFIFSHKTDITAKPTKMYKTLTRQTQQLDRSNPGTENTYNEDETSETDERDDNEGRSLLGRDDRRRSWSNAA